MRDSDNTNLPAVAGSNFPAKYQRALASHDGRPLFPVTPTSHLIPADELPVVVEVLERSVAPASPRDVRKAVLTIGAAWPHSYQRLEPDQARAHIAMLEEDLGHFPADVLVQTLAELRRELTFAPAIAELWKRAQSLMTERRVQLRIARDHQREHERRAAERQAEAERDGAYRRDMEARLARLADLHEDAARYIVDELIAAMSTFIFIGGRMASAWFRGLDHGERWIADTLPVAALAAPVCELVRTGAITHSAASAIFSTIAIDLERGRRVVEALQAGAVPQPSDDAAVIWDHPSRVLVDVLQAAGAPSW